MRLNLVTVNSGWILQKIAERMAAHMPSDVECVVTNQPYYATNNGVFDAFFYADIQNCYHNYKPSTPDAIHVGYITHAHENSQEWLRHMFNQQNVWELDGIKSMNQRYTDMVKKIGWTKPILTTIPPASADDFPLRKTRLLIANRGGFVGYGHDFMLELPDKYESFLKENFKFTFLGNGWEPIIEKYVKNNIDVVHYPDENTDYPDTYRSLYEEVDYLLVPILWTAGPYCAMEAHLVGTPIIASDVGLVNYEVEPEYCYPPGDKGALLDILIGIRSRLSVRRSKIIQLNTWQTYTEKVINFIREIKGE